MDSKSFWLGWLNVASLGLIVFGMAMTFFNQSELFSWLTRAMEKSFPGEVTANSIGSQAHWLIAVIGSMLIGWGVCIYALVKFPLRNGEKWAWTTLLISLITWYILDNFISLYFGARFNLLINTFILLQILGPLLFLRPHMNQNKSME